MKTIGILGGMSSASTALYYKQLNLGVRARLGGLHSAQILLRSLDFALIAELQAKNDWSTAGALLNQEALALERGGAELLLLATNTMHKVSSLVTAGLEIPFLHIGDATARAITAAGLSHPGLIATSYTMSETFYTGRLKEAGLHTVLPVEDDRELTHRIIYEELCKDIITTRSRRRYEGIAEVAQRCANLLHRVRAKQSQRSQLSLHASVLPCCGQQRLLSLHVTPSQSNLIQTYPILSYPILSCSINPVQSNPIQNNPIQSKPIPPFASALGLSRSRLCHLRLHRGGDATR